ncbi:MAG: hypothetical protein AAFU57_14530, partial [Bacteroidota bacterium]
MASIFALTLGPDFSPIRKIFFPVHKVDSLLRLAIIFNVNGITLRRFHFLSNDKLPPIQKSIQGEVQYFFEVEKALDSFYLDAKKMNISQVLLNDKPVK